MKRPVIPSPELEEQNPHSILEARVIYITYLFKKSMGISSLLKPLLWIVSLEERLDERKSNLILKRSLISQRSSFRKPANLFPKDIWTY